MAIPYYDTRGTPVGHNGVLVNRYLTASVEGGETFLPAARVSSVPTDNTPKGAVGVNMTRTREGQFDRDFVGLVKSGAPAGNDYLGLTADSEGAFHDKGRMFNMIHVVTCHLYGRISNCNPTTLGMNTETLPLVTCERFQERQILRYAVI